MTGLNPLRTVIASAAGAFIGGYLGGLVAGQALSASGGGGLEDIATALMAALGVGVVGATLALVAVFWQAPGRQRLVMSITMLIVAPPAALLAAVVGSRTEYTSVLLAAVLLAVALTALLARWLSLRLSPAGE